MMSCPTLSRRALLEALALLGVGQATATRAEIMATSKEKMATKAAVVFFSRSGNTRVIAGQIHRALNAPIIEIEAERPYPEDYEQTVDQARRERDSGYEPALKSGIPDLGGYDTVYIGFPIWGETTPPVIRSFLTAHDLSEKTVFPFITHGGYGLGDSLSVIARRAPRARLAKAFSMEADQERRTLTQVTGWLNDIHSTRNT